jgi:hypothetical protein
MGIWRRVAELIEAQKAARPEMRARDAYKLLYQGVFGVGHIMGPGAWDYLQSEAATLDIKDHPEDPIIEEVALDGSVVRVNLRPFLREGYSLVKLMEAMRLSDIAGSPAAFLEAWDAFAELVWSGQLDFEHNEVDAINKALDRTKPQPMHHTQQYRDAYYPAYRVVRRREIFWIIGI